MSESAIRSFSGEFRFLSNFFPSKVIATHRSGLSLAALTVEHAFQAMKCESMEEFQAIIKAPTPGQAKRLGRRAKLRADWLNDRVLVMQGLLAQKFLEPELAKMLIATGNAELWEGNWWHDNFWGACDCTRCKLEPKWNRLGRLLMQGREAIKGR